jgi:hypothetical protein
MGSIGNISVHFRGSCRVRDGSFWSLVDGGRTAWYFPAMQSQFRSTLWKVLAIQGVALLLLWLLQSRYAS